MVPEDGEAGVGIIPAAVVNMQPSTVAQLEISLGHHFSDKFSHAFDGGWMRDGQLAIAPRTTPGLTSVRVPNPLRVWLNVSSGVGGTFTSALVAESPAE